VQEGRLPTTAAGLQGYFGPMGSVTVAIETGTHSPWVSRVLSSLGHKVLVANSRKLRLIYENRRKRDQVDARNLAKLARLDPELLFPVHHRSELAQRDLAVLRSREALVSARTQMVNHVRGSVKSMGSRLPKCSTRSFHKQAGERMPEALKETLSPILETIAVVTEQIRRFDRRIEVMAREVYPEAQRSTPAWAWDRRAGWQERQEAGGGSGGQEAFRAAASALADGRGLPASLQHPGSADAGAGERRVRRQETIAW